MLGSSLKQRDLKHVWHPCSQMKEYADHHFLAVQNAKGSTLYLENGVEIVDAISSWWCKSLGHGHPRLQQALKQQMDRFEHVILAGTTNETIVNLSEKLATFLPGLNKVFYASDGSCAVEIAMKMSLHMRQLNGENHRTEFIALENGYHGETIATLSVSDLGLYRDPYQSVLFPCHFLKPLPYVSGSDDPLWEDCSEFWPEIEMQLNEKAATATAILFEPIVQGAGGMKIYSPDLLKRIAKWTKLHGVHLIADEIMTGMHRCGPRLACELAGIVPDFICLSKGLTSGFLPLSAVLTSQTVYDVFYADYALGRSFLHSHTYSGNALAAAVALEVIKIMEEECMNEKVDELSHHMQDAMKKIMTHAPELINFRGIGGVAAMDLAFPLQQRKGYEVYKKALELGVLLRPLGNTVYWLPPLNIKESKLEVMFAATQRALELTL